MISVSDTMPDTKKLLFRYQIKVYLNTIVLIAYTNNGIPLTFSFKYSILYMH